jgi:hypothetical protein
MRLRLRWKDGELGPLGVCGDVGDKGVCSISELGDGIVSAKEDAEGPR